MSSLNEQIRQAINSFDTEGARLLLRDAMKEADAETYYLASKVALDDDQKTEFLKRAVELDPFHEKARAALKAISPASADEELSSVNISEIGKESDKPKAQNKQAFVVGRVTSDANDINIYILPINTSTVRTQVRKETEIYLLERDIVGEYYRVIYASPAGMVDGWMKDDSISDIHVNNVVINPMDLPITKYDYHKREEVKNLISLKQKSITNPHQGGTCLGQLFLISGAIIALGSGVYGENWIWSAVFGAIGIVFGLFVFRGNNKKSTEWLEMYPAEYQSKIQEQIKRLNQIEKELRSDYEVMRDDQRRDALMSFGLNLGSNLITTAASNYIPDRKKVTVERRTTRK